MTEQSTSYKMSDNVKHLMIAYEALQASEWGIKYSENILVEIIRKSTSPGSEEENEAWDMYIEAIQEYNECLLLHGHLIPLICATIGDNKLYTFQRHSIPQRNAFINMAFNTKK